MTETIQQPKRKPGRPPRVIATSGALHYPVEPPDPGHYRAIAQAVFADRQPLLAARFREAAPIGFANRAENSATTSQDGRMHVSVDWTRRVVVVLTKEGSGTCETLIPLENVKSMRPMPEKPQDAA